MSVFGRNQEGYPDPTAAEAIVKASKKKYLSLVYICSKYSGDVVTNTEAAKRYSRFAEESRGKRKADVLPDRNGRKERLRKAVCRPRILIII